MKKLMEKEFKMKKQKGIEFVEVLACIAVVLLLAVVFKEQLGLFVEGLITKLNTMSATGIFA